MPNTARYLQPGKVYLLEETIGQLTASGQVGSKPEVFILLGANPEH